MMLWINGCVKICSGLARALLWLAKNITGAKSEATGRYVCRPRDVRRAKKWENSLRVAQGRVNGRKSLRDRPGRPADGLSDDERRRERKMREAIRRIQDRNRKR